MKSALKAVSLPFLLLILSCGDKSTEDGWQSTSTFPLTTGSRWEYTLNHYDVPYNDSSLADTQTFSILRYVIGPDTLINSDRTIAVDDSTLRIDTTDVIPFVNRHLYCISDGKLKEYGQGFFYVGDDPEITYYDPPHTLLDFPLEMNKAWTESTENYFSVYSTVVGIQYISIGDNDIKCDVIRSRMIDERTGHLYYDSYWWYSGDGLMHNEFDFGVRIINGETGNPIDSVRSIQVLELTDFEIQ